MKTGAPPGTGSYSYLAGASTANEDDTDLAMAVQGLGPHRTRPDWSLEAQLSRLGVQLADVDTVILTHLHYDHAGGCALFLRARFIVQRSELAAAAAPLVPRALEVGGGALFYDRRDIAALVDALWPRVELIEGTRRSSPWVRCVLYADSHTPGSQAVYIQTAAGTVVLVGDIARNVDRNITQGIPPGLFYDLEATRRALRRIRQDAAVALPSHDYAIYTAWAGGLPPNEQG